MNVAQPHLELAWPRLGVYSVWIVDSVTLYCAAITCTLHSNTISILYRVYRDSSSSSLTRTGDVKRYVN